MNPLTPPAILGKLNTAISRFVNTRRTVSALERRLDDCNREWQRMSRQGVTSTERQRWLIRANKLRREFQEVQREWDRERLSVNH